MTLSIDTSPPDQMAEPSWVKIVRPSHIAGTVVFVNGLGGCGKTLLAPVMGSFERVEIMKYNYQLEHFCVLHYLNLLDVDVAASLVRNYTDLDLYNLIMSRETNFRPSDLSSVLMNARPWRYLRRLFLPEGEPAVERIQRERPILNLVTHHLLGVSSPLFEGLGERLRFIEVVRHPLYMVKQWFKWMPRIGHDPRIFALCFEYEGRSVPWFARGWEERWLRSGDMDRVIYGIEDQSQLGGRALARLSEAQRRQVLVISFERFVIDPVPFVRHIEALLDTRAIPATWRMLRRQRVPRKMYAEGIGLPIYKYYGWQPPEPGADERRELQKRRDFAAQHASPEAMEVLDRLCASYEAAYLRGDDPGR